MHNPCGWILVMTGILCLGTVETNADQPMIPTAPHYSGAPYPDGLQYGGHEPGGYEGSAGRPYYWTGDGVRGVGSPQSDPYTYHFGPGFYRSADYGHYRFPYYSYRRPWYNVGHPVYVRDTNLPW
ncbi:hypothetical protein [Calycomorphotria hydatis]|uniref:Uncharacterized protein n=1 Tax=Calycomorphotria hydatis TaxID=2528027 RepID=A0A517T3E8_9PLAN|nr:hypothetical protein [Calycomorphotria hydatis]QDT62861.1 hypothetical protein V22_00590 [Calycomorphotria hydatis]